MGIYETPACGHMPEELMNKADCLFDEAESLAEDETVLWRVQCARMALRYCRLWQRSPEDPQRVPELQQFTEDLDRFGFDRLREARPLQKSIELLYQDPEHNERW